MGFGKSNLFVKYRWVIRVVVVSCRGRWGVKGKWVSTLLVSLNVTSQYIHTNTIHVKLLLWKLMDNPMLYNYLYFSSPYFSFLLNY